MTVLVDTMRPGQELFDVCDRFGLIAAAAVILLFAAPASADLNQGDFDDGLAGGEPDPGADQIIKPPKPHDGDEGFGQTVDANQSLTEGEAAVDPSFLATAPKYASAYVYHLNDDDRWERTAILTAHCRLLDYVSSSGYSESASFDENTIAIAAPSNDGTCDSYRTGIHVFKRSSLGEWSETTVIDPPAGIVEVSGDVMAWADPTGDDSYGIYERTSEGSWTSVLDETGHVGSVAIQDSADTLGVAAFGMPDQDSVVIYRQDLSGAWSRSQTLHEDCPPPTACPDSFGLQVDMAPTAGKKIVPGAPSADVSTGDAFEFVDTADNQYTYSASLTNADGDDWDEFGRASNAWDGTSIVGAPGWENDLGYGDGAVYVFDAGESKGKLLPAE